MKVAIVGSRSIIVEDLNKFLPKNMTEIVSGGANGIDSCAKKYAIKNGLIYTEFLPEYEKYRRYAPIKRNMQIVEYSDFIIAFWNGESRGTRFVIDYCSQKNKPVKIIIMN